MVVEAECVLMHVTALAGEESEFEGDKLILSSFRVIAT